MKQKKLRQKIWDWLTMFSNSFAIATILVVVLSLSFNGFDKAHVILEFNELIRRLEIGGGIVSLIVITINWFDKLGAMARHE